MLSQLFCIHMCHCTTVTGWHCFTVVTHCFWSYSLSSDFAVILKPWEDRCNAHFPFRAGSFAVSFLCMLGVSAPIHHLLLMLWVSVHQRSETKLLWINVWDVLICRCNSNPLEVTLIPYPFRRTTADSPNTYGLTSQTSHRFCIL